MKRLLICLSILAIVFAVQAFAENNTVVKVHVENAVAIPGKVLLPGDYTFRLDGAGRNVVEISSADSKTVYGFIPVFTTYRSSGGGNEIRTIAPEASGVARIDSWYFPGEQNGYRFIYSKAETHKAGTMNGTQSGQ